MTLPRTISGVQFPDDSYYMGPVRNADGNHYICIPDSTDQGIVEMWKADNGDATWAEQDSANHPSHTASRFLSVFMSSDVLHVVRGSTGASVYYNPFQMSNHASPDVWGTEQTVQSSGATNTIYDGDIAVRSDGDIVVATQSSPETLKGKDYERITIYINEGTDFTDVTMGLDDGGSVSYTGVRMVLAESDNIYFFYKDDSDTLYYKVLDSTNSLSSALAVSDTATDARNFPALKPVYYDDSGTETVIVGWLKSSDAKIAVSTITEGGTPGAEVTGISDNTVEAAGPIVAFLTVDQTNKKVYLVSADDTTQDVYIDTDVIGGGETDTEILDAVTVNHISAGILVNDSGDTVNAYVYDDGGTIKYNEYVVVTGSTLQDVIMSGIIPFPR